MRSETKEANSVSIQSKDYCPTIDSSEEVPTIRQRAVRESVPGLASRLIPAVGSFQVRKTTKPANPFLAG